MARSTKTTSDGRPVSTRTYVNNHGVPTTERVIGPAQPERHPFYDVQAAEDHKVALEHAKGGVMRTWGVLVTIHEPATATQGAEIRFESHLIKARDQMTAAFYAREMAWKKLCEEQHTVYVAAHETAYMARALQDWQADHQASHAGMQDLHGVDASYLQRNAGFVAQEVQRQAKVLCDEAATRETSITGLKASGWDITVDFEPADVSAGETLYHKGVTVDAKEALRKQAKAGASTTTAEKATKASAKATKSTVVSVDEAKRTLTAALQMRKDAQASGIKARMAHAEAMVNAAKAQYMAAMKAK